MSRGFTSSYRIVLLAGGLFVSFAALGARLVWLHVIDRDELLRTIAKARQQMIVENAKRGDILDANGAILATSRPLIVVGVDPGALRQGDEKKWPQLAALLGMPELDLRRILTTKFRGPGTATPAATASSAPRPAGLVFNLNPPSGPPPPPAVVPSALAAEKNDDDFVPDFGDDTGGREIHWAKLSDRVSEKTFAAIDRLGIRGVYAPPRSYTRVYPNNELAAHLIGYVDREQHPRAGIEFYADFYLRGQNGWRVGERDGRNRELAQFRRRDVPRADGYSVTLSIDSRVQDIVEQELAFIAQKFQPLKATIIVSNPRTGFILGLANYPTFNLNEYNHVPSDAQASMKNVAVADVYEPGSVFKIVAASGALEERLVTPTTLFDCSQHEISYHGRVLGLPADDHPFDDPQNVSLARVISYSSNRGAAQLGLLLGEERLYRYARAFGFGQTLGFPVGGEVAGIFNRPEKWNAIDITRIPIGHTIAATALQMHQAMSAIASGGVLLRPQLIREIRDATGALVFSYDRAELGRAVSERTAQTMAKLLTGVASKEGTAPEAAIDGYEVAGKTGTAEKLLPEPDSRGEMVLRYSHRHHVASFVGFFPASRPQVAISVIVDDADAHAPGGVAYGKGVAAPSFHHLGLKLIPILDIRTGRAPASSLAVVAAMEGGGR